MSYTSIHNHTNYSIQDGYSSPREYLERAKEIGLKGFAISEHGNQYSWIYFDEIKKEYPEIKMIYGVEFYECWNKQEQDKDNKYFHLIALARNENGRKALNKLITIGNFEGFYFKPRIELNDIIPFANDLVISSACLASKIARETDYKKSLEYVMEYKKSFPHFFLEMQSHSHVQQSEYNNKILQLSQDSGVPFIITCDSHSATKEDLKYQSKWVEVGRNSTKGKKEKENTSEIYEGCYLQTEEEIHEIMDSQIGVDNVNLGLKNTDLIYDLIDEVNMPFQEPKLPHFIIPKEFSNNREYLEFLVKEGWKNRNIDSKKNIKVYEERLKYELKVICDMDYEGYFFIVWDFINYAKINKIPVGAGRGSGAGSLICYLLNITNLDPIVHGLIFQRFLNPERISLPDLDIDFADRDFIIQYLQQKYGYENVCQVLNLNEETPKVAIKDAGKVLGISYDVLEKISQLFVLRDFDKCVESSKTKLAQYVEKYPELFDVASHFTGRIRNVSTHACAVGITDDEITEYMGLSRGSNGERVIQVDKIMVEAIGIVKVDILGVKTLAVVQHTLDLINKSLDIIDPNKEEFLTDKKMFELLCNATTNGIFQVESAGMKDLLKKLSPNNMGDVSAVLALYRPDTMNLLEDYIYNKNNPSEITYIHDDMKPILEKDYGCMIYQETMMDIVRVFGGRTYGGADKFRKGIGKKDLVMVQKEATELYKEILNTGYEESLALKISEEMRLKGGYMFNKSHSFAYAVLTLQTAYLKAHYPLEYMTALLCSVLGDYPSTSKYINDSKQLGLKILPPNIINSQRNFSIYQNGILFGLQTIKNVGEKAVDVILARRNKSIKSFKLFLDSFSNDLDKKTIISLVKAGCFGQSQKKFFLEKYAEYLSQNKLNESVFKPLATFSGYTLKKLKEELGIDEKDKDLRLKLFNEAKEKMFYKEQEEKNKKNLENTILEFKEKYLTNEEMWEFETLSMFITHDPFEKYKSFFKPINEIKDNFEGTVLGTLTDITKKTNKNKKRFAYIEFYNNGDIIEIACWASQFEQFENLFEKGKNLVIKVKKKGSSLSVVNVKPFELWKEEKKIS
jgi:DNA polymerase-3 subunit alpha